jgi:hypothetical protein
MVTNGQTASENIETSELKPYQSNNIQDPYITYHSLFGSQSYPLDVPDRRWEGVQFQDRKILQSTFKTEFKLCRAS